MDAIDRDARTIVMGDEKADVSRFLAVAATFALGVLIGFLGTSWAILGLLQ